MKLLTRRACASTIAIFATTFGNSISAQWLNHPTPGIPRTYDGKPNLAAPAPRAPDGKPDLSGLWTRISPKYGRNIAADLKPGDMKPWVEGLLQERTENLQKDYMNVQCVPLGPGYTTAGDSTGTEMMKIIQTPGIFLILNPDLSYRQIYTDGRELEKTPNPDWMGYSVGHWDGDTFVVESNGYNDHTWLDHDGHPHTEALRVTERYHRRDFGNMDIDVTTSDPGAYAKPWTVSVRAELAPDTEMLEWVCNENRFSIQHWIGKASDEEKNALKVPVEVLSKYVGTYVEQPRLWSRTGVPRVVTISVDDGKIYADMDGRGKAALLASSETEFSGMYGLGIEFTKNGPSPTEQLFVKHVSGNYKFLRKK